MKRVCIYCASSARVNSVYFEATERLAKQLVEEDIEVVFGGGAKGLMGKLADTVIEEGGRIKGIMPQFMKDVEWAHKGVANFEFTTTMHERKTRFLFEVDGIITLPGGCGTLEELLEVITLKRLGLFTKPIVILNTNDYFGPLKAMLEKCVEEKFLNTEHLQMWTFVDQSEEIIPALRNAPKWDKEAIKFAAGK